LGHISVPGLSEQILTENGSYLYATVVGDGVVWWLLRPETRAVQCDALSLCFSLSVYLFIYLVYVVLYGKERKHEGAAGPLFASYQGTRINESRKTAKYFTKYCASQIAEED